MQKKGEFMADDIFEELESFQNRSGEITLVKISMTKYKVFYSLKEMPGVYRWHICDFTNYADAAQKFNQCKEMLISARKKHTRGK